MNNLKKYFTITLGLLVALSFADIDAMRKTTKKPTIKKTKKPTIKKRTKKPATKKVVKKERTSDVLADQYGTLGHVLRNQKDIRSLIKNRENDEAKELLDKNLAGIATAETNIELNRKKIVDSVPQKGGNWLTNKLKKYFQNLGNAVENIIAKDKKEATQSLSKAEKITTELKPEGPIDQKFIDRMQKTVRELRETTRTIKKDDEVDYKYRPKKIPVFEEEYPTKQPKQPKQEEQKTKSYRYETVAMKSRLFTQARDFVQQVIGTPEEEIRTWFKTGKTKKIEKFCKTLESKIGKFDQVTVGELRKQGRNAPAFTSRKPLFKVIYGVSIQQIMKYINDAIVMSASTYFGLEGGMNSLDRLLIDMQKQAVQGETVATAFILANLWRKYCYYHNNKKHINLVDKVNKRGLKRGKCIFTKDQGIEYIPTSNYIKLSELEEYIDFDKVKIGLQESPISFEADLSTKFSVHPRTKLQTPYMELSDGTRNATQLIAYSFRFKERDPLLNDPVALETVKRMLQGQYESSYWLAKIKKQPLLLTVVGGGAFRNPIDMIMDAMAKHIEIIKDAPPVYLIIPQPKSHTSREFKAGLRKIQKKLQSIGVSFEEEEFDPIKDQNEIKQEFTTGRIPTQPQTGFRFDIKKQTYPSFFEFEKQPVIPEKKFSKEKLSTIFEQLIQRKNDQLRFEQNNSNWAMVSILIDEVAIIKELIKNPNIKKRELINMGYDQERVSNLAYELLSGYDITLP